MRSVLDVLAYALLIFSADLIILLKPVTRYYDILGGLMFGIIFMMLLEER